jgi:hypothetical protein
LCRRKVNRQKRSKKLEKPVDTPLSPCENAGTHGNGKQKDRNMRTRTLLLTAALLAAGAASTMAQVYSVNTVGYVNVTLVGGGKYTAVANPLNTTNNTLLGLLSALPNTSQVLKYDPSISDYHTYGKLGANFTGGGNTVTLDPGEGCLILTPLASSDITITFVGDVLQATTDPTKMTNAMSTGYQLVANVIPDSGPVNTLEMTNVPSGSQILKWDTSIQDFRTFGKLGTGPTWTPSVPSINVAESFFVNATGPFNWVRTFVVH